jgi:hypothetical protein
MNGKDWLRILTIAAVLCLAGPLSHILTQEERLQAAAELVRVVKPGAPVFISVIARLSLLVTELVLFPEEIELPIFTRIRDTGDYEGDYGRKALNKLAKQPARWERWLETHMITSTHPAVVGTSEHILYIGRKQVD